MELSTGAALDFWTLEDDDAGRGRKYGLLIVDEAAMARHLEAAWNAALSPTLTDYQGGAWFFSTPKGRNHFWKLTLEGDKDSDWAHHHAPSSENPYLPAVEIERQRTRLPERIFAQEYLAQFLEDGGGVFRRVTAAIDTDLEVDPHEAKPILGKAYVIGVDWGRHEDFTVISVINATTGELVAIDRFTQIDYALQLARLQAVHLRFPRAPILAESNSMGGPLIEQLQKMRLPVQAFHTSAASKTQAIEALALAFEQGNIRIPAVQWLLDELLAFDQERLPSGTMRYCAPKGGHDDGVMSLAIAWSGVAYAANPYQRTMMANAL
jgi:phage FluMu gp28-like protein